MATDSVVQYMPINLIGKLLEYTENNKTLCIFGKP